MSTYSQIYIQIVFAVKHKEALIAKEEEMGHGRDNMTAILLKLNQLTY